MTDRLTTLSTKLENGSISDRELQEFEDLLEHDYQLRERYLDHSMVEGLLYAISDLNKNEQASIVPISSENSAQATNPSRYLILATLATAALVIAGLFVWIASDNNPPPTTEFLGDDETKQRLSPVEQYDRAILASTGGASQAHPESVKNEVFNNGEIEFNRDIRPILSDNCVFCHGPDAAERKADLRFDTEEGAMAAIVKGDASASELIARVFHTDEDELMPPPESSRSLSQIEKDLLRKWIDQGAKWQKHWAFEPAKKPESKGIDVFVEKRLTEHGFEFSPEAPKETLLRRVSLDLTGIPPTLEETQAFLQDNSPNAYEKVVDRLLDSPRYAERMTWQWLEAARYADTDGYQNDGPRDMWRWRDWVIDAYANNKSFDQFTIEQLAGDLLPNPTLEQKIATGFNRNNRYNSEAGLVLEEFLLENAVDRVDTTSTVWMGVTMACARCHDHKYDPFSQKEYYQLISFFDAIPESGRAIKFGNSEPWIKAPTEPQFAKLKEIDQRLEKAKQTFAELEPKIQQQLKSNTVSTFEKPLVSRGLAHHLTEPVLSDGKVEKKLIKENVKGTDCQSRFSITLRVKPQQVDRGSIFSTESRATTRKGIFLRF